MGHRGLAVLRAVPILALLLALAGTRAARADGFIIIAPPEPPPRVEPIPPLRSHFFPLAVKLHHVRVKIADQMATTEVDEVFSNPNPVELEGTYVFPMPEDAAPSKFSLFVDGREVEAELLDASRARAIYEGFVRRARDPGLLEYMGRGLFRARIYPIPARGEARVKLSYQQVLRADAGLCEYRYPLSTEKWSAAPLEDAEVDVTIEGALGVSTVFSPSHAVTIDRSPRGGAHVRWHERGTVPDRDFALCFQRAERGRELDMTLVTERPPGEDGYFLLLLAPPPDLAASKPCGKDIVFVLDTSGSMAGPKMEQAKGALRYCLRSLAPADRFAVIDFATEVREFREGLAAASEEAVRSAIEYVDRMAARGGTAIDDALRRALERKGERGRPFMIVFVTDGEPTIGVTEPAEIERRVASARAARSSSQGFEDDLRLFVFGVGNDVNANFLDRLAEANRGAHEYVAESESVELKVSRFFDKIAAPVLSDLKVDIPGVETYDLYPRPLPDLFRGEEASIAGRFRGGAGPRSVHVSGRLDGHPVEFVAALGGAVAAGSGHAFVPRAFALKKVAFLLDQIRLHGETDEVRREVVALAREFGIVTPYTSYLVIEDERRLGMAGGSGGEAAARALEGIRRKGDLGRFDEEAKGALEKAAAGAPAPAGETSRRRAIEASEAAKKLAAEPLSAAATPGADLAGSVSAMGRFLPEGKDRPRGTGSSEEAESLLKDSLRLVCGRAFYRAGETWVDARMREGVESRKITYLSDDYFKLVADRPDLARILALGPSVRFMDGAKAIEVGP